jgi:hypothetical protein
LREAAEREKKQKLKQKKAGKGKTDKDRVAAEKAAREAEEKERAAKDEQERLVREEEERVKRLEQLELLRKQVRGALGRGVSLRCRGLGRNLGPTGVLSSTLWQGISFVVLLQHLVPSIPLRLLLGCLELVKRWYIAGQGSVYPGLSMNNIVQGCKKVWQ